MARMIDGDKLVENLRLIATCWSISPFVSKEKHNGAVDMLREVEREVKEAPTLTPPNEPLTIERLREMGGEPVWVKQLKGLSVCDTDWAVVEFRLEPDVKHDKIRVWWPGSEDEDTPSEDDYGKTWLAYRRPPEGEEGDANRG